MKSLAVYEGSTIRKITGPSLRPGGFLLTDRAIRLLGPSEGLRGLDIGCGLGATINHVREKWKLDMEGVDQSKILLAQARDNFGLELVEAQADKLPFPDESFDFVLMECSLSLMEDSRAALSEAARILKTGGHLFISDVYAKNPQHLEALEEVNIKTCLRGVFDLEVLRSDLEGLGLEIFELKDFSQLLRQLMVDIVFAYGSMNSFWTRTGCSDVQGFKEKIKKCRPGYFQVWARKGEGSVK
ncbi:MAG: methyltransferase domain-containing protein [Tissierellia bacterium]|nr:methyltransferase domain-containing protein [Tissierellia bacterium]